MHQTGHSNGVMCTEGYCTLIWQYFMQTPSNCRCMDDHMTPARPKTAMFASAGDGVCIDVVIERGPIKSLLTQSRWRRSTGRLELLWTFFPNFLPFFSLQSGFD